MIKVKTYDNGLKLIVNENEYVKSVSIGILVGAGSYKESPTENGISHFIEHVNFKGTKKRTAFQISDEIDCIGAQINAFTAKDLTCYYVKCTYEHIDESFDVLSDIYLNSVYPEDEIDKERNVIIEEINMTEDSPEDLCLEKIATAYFGDGGYGAPILGPIKNAKRFSKADILAYKNKYYTPDNTVISFAGKISFEKAAMLVEKYFSDFSGKYLNDGENINTACLMQDLVVDKPIEQAHIALGIPSLSITDKNRYSALCVSTVLGGGMSSRLFQKVREERGLAYSVYSYLTAYTQTGIEYFYAGVNPQSVVAAYDSIISEIDLISKKGITERELNRVKEQLKCSIVLSSESTSSQMLSYGKRLLLVDEIYDLDKEFDRISSITLEQANSCAEKYFKTDVMATAIVGKNVKSLR